MSIHRKPNEKGFTNLLMLLVIVTGVVGLVAASNTAASSPMPEFVPRKNSFNPPALNPELEKPKRENGNNIQKPFGEKPEIELENQVEKEIETAKHQDIEFKNIGGEFEVDDSEASSSSNLSRVLNDENENQASSSGNLNSQKAKNKVRQLKVKVKHDNQEDEVELVSEDSGTKIDSKGTIANTNFPLSINSQTGELQVSTPNGLKTIRVLPDQASEIAEHQGIQNKLISVDLEENQTSDTSDEAVFKVTGLKTGKVLGLFTVNAQVETQVGAQTGNVLGTKQPLWVKILSPIIF